MSITETQLTGLKIPSLIHRAVRFALRDSGIGLVIACCLVLAVGGCSAGDPDESEQIASFDAGPSDIPEQTGTGSEFLGRGCGDNAEEPECPVGYECFRSFENLFYGFCTAKCEWDSSENTCGAEYGYQGPGMGSCGLSQGEDSSVCVVICDSSDDDPCPEGLVCDDQFCLPPLAEF